MKSLSTLLRALQKSSYLESSTNAQNSVINFNLLNNGERFKTQLIENWRKTKNIRIPNEYYVENELYTYDDSRTSFINSDEFRDNIKHIRTNTLTRCPAIIKSKRTISINSTNVEKTNTDILLVSNRLGSTQIIFDYFFNCETGLENFYNIERERKIWWMRNSANPSRYFLESYDLNSTSNSIDGIAKSQSTTVKTRFSFGNASLETITLVPLSEVPLKHANDFYFKSQHAGHKILPAVVRSVINVETATAVLLLDGCDNERINTLLLNRKLVPYQCIIACLHNGKMQMPMLLIQKLTLQMICVICADI
ncbi:DNA polymerase subunit gamma-2, mitochondrial isoform X2 [Teleopsis dalmanni]|uniref:DNA polymerase subunit gamma-2, mitochondrial isoform X2 n=1 Tax=Teleopsis dalmanni TaxID=139649 RepID=UPI0018CF3740|nr:DNA polymerase subunit gamma-2, mitochondrial isoform X2 [Teleopsis dalmanni]